eukprot:GEMP01064166.1.p1 GENE.GEMP01064166.1~~GEMP01064166.1.p1  ORF type:complete len:182 (+),score=31.49 GEMP01064166.1:112-657(+)
MNQSDLRDIQLRHRQRYEVRRNEEEEARKEDERKKEEAEIERRKQEEKDRQMKADEELCRQLQEEMNAEANAVDDGEIAAGDTGVDADGIRAPMRTGYVDRLVDEPWYGPPATFNRTIEQAREAHRRPDTSPGEDEPNYSQRILFLFFIGLSWALVTWYKPEAKVPAFSICSVLTLLVLCL